MTQTSGDRHIHWDGEQRVCRKPFHEHPRASLLREAQSRSPWACRRVSGSRFCSGDSLLIPYLGSDAFTCTSVKRLIGPNGTSCNSANLSPHLAD